MACEVAMMTPQVDVQTMDNLYNQAAWNHPLSPELSHAHSPLGSIHSPASSVRSPAALSHVGSPIPATMVGCCSPVSAHSPNMQAAVHSPIVQGSPAVECMLRSIKQEHLEVDHMRFSSSCALENHHESLSSLLRNNEMIAVQNMAMVPPHMGPPHPREILDGKLDYCVCVLLFLIATRANKEACWRSSYFWTLSNSECVCS